MNHIYRIVFNRALGVHQVASENASSHRAGSKRLALSVTGALVMAALAGAPAGVFAQAIPIDAGGYGGAGGMGSSLPTIPAGAGGAPEMVGVDAGNSATPGAPGGGGGGAGSSGGKGGIDTSNSGTPSAGGMGGSNGGTVGNTTTGGNGSNGLSAVSIGDGGGGGGGGQTAANISNSPTLADIYIGGNGGNGGTGGLSGGGGGGGGAGGYGLRVTAGDVMLTETAVVTGGKGGAGGSSMQGYAGTGGEGGIGVLFSSAGVLTNAGQIKGGVGGNGGGGQSHGTGANGIGGAGVVLGDNATLINMQNTNGDSGIYGGTMAAVPGLFVAPGGGTGVVAGSNTLILNDSLIAGGTGNTPLKHGNAVEIYGNNSRLVMQANGTLDGNAISTGIDNTLEFNLVQSNKSLDVTNIVTSTPTTYASFQPQFYGFSNYEKTGDGKLSLTGSTAAVTNWMVTGGTLGIDNESNLGAAGSKLTLDGATLFTDHNVTITSAHDITLGAAGGTVDLFGSGAVQFAGVISGSGGLTKTGPNVIELQADNTYTGVTHAAGGTIKIGNGATAGSVAGDIAIDAGALVEFDRTDSSTYGGTISGAGGVKKSNTGTLILTGDSTFTGGINVEAGTLQIANGITSGSILSDVSVSSGATLAFNHRNSSSHPYDAYDYVGNISGDGQVVVRENAEVSFIGNATHTGGTVLEPYATLALGNGGMTGSLSGDVTLQNSAAFGFIRSDDYTYAGKITGDSTSRVVQAGTGTTSLTGDNSGFSGQVYVTNGTLEINSTMNGIAAVMGGTLAGTGQLAMAQIGDGSTLSPGSKANPTGTLTVNGPVQFASGSTLSITALPDGSSSKLVANGAAMVQDGAKFLMVGQDNGLYAESTTYNVLQATSGVTGKFTTVGSSLAFLEPSLSYTANTVDLTIKLKDVPVDPGQGGTGGGDTGTGNTGGNGNTGSGGTRPIQFADLALNRNQRSVAGALQSLPKNSALYARVLNLPEGAPSAVFESLSGETHASTSNMLNGVTSNVVSLPMQHLRQNMDAGMMPGRPTAQIGRGDASSLPQSAAQPVWAQVFGNWRTLGGRDESAEVRQSDGGLFVGGDQAVGGGWRAGGALGYTGSHSSIKGQGSRADVDSYSGVIYGGKGFAAGPGKVNLTLGMSYTWHDIDTKRGVNAAGVSQELKSSYSANTAQFFTELGYALPVTDRITLEPFVGADYSDQRTRGFAESGGDAALMGQSTHNQVGSSTLGLRAQTTFESGSSQGRLYATAGWRHSYGDLDPTTTMAFDGSQAFSVAGAPIARDAAVLSLGADLAITRNTTVGINYGGQFGGGNRQNSGAVNVRWRF